jgi:hypothetical protein
MPVPARWSWWSVMATPVPAVAGPWAGDVQKPPGCRRRGLVGWHRVEVSVTRTRSELNRI